MSDTGPPIYVVDDDLSVRESVGSLIRSAGFKVQTFGSAQELLARLEAAAPSCLVLDVQLPGISGLDLQQELAKADVRLPIIFLTGHGDIPTTVRAMKAGALEFLTKPCDGEELLNAIRQGIAITGYHEPRNRVGELPQPSFDGIIGASDALRAVLNQVERVALTESTVLILGETGTGKELIARAVHKRSHRCSRPFVGVNCAAIPRDLIASELFGHEKGAFTGANQRRVGRFEMADGGTIFLDEIGELPAETQIALLRVLQEHEFERIGGTRSIRTNVRVSAATNRNLHSAMSTGSFRTDLFYRLNVFPIHIPPLRERREDVPLLVEHFMCQYANKSGKKIKSIEKSSLAQLQAYSWPGNIRELQNIVERAVICCEAETLSVNQSWLSAESCWSQSSGEPFTDKLCDQEKQMIEEALAKTRGTVSGPSGAATILRLPASTLESKIRSLKIDKFRFKRP